MNLNCDIISKHVCMCTVIFVMCGDGEGHAQNNIINKFYFDVYSKKPNQIELPKPNQIGTPPPPKFDNILFMQLFFHAAILFF